MSSIDTENDVNDGDMLLTRCELYPPPRISDFPSEIAHAHEIIPGVWLGNYYSSHDVDFLKMARIKSIFNCTKTLPICKEATNIKQFYRIPVEDNLEPIEI